MSTLLILMAACAIPAAVLAYVFAVVVPDEDEIEFGGLFTTFLVLDVGAALVILWAVG